MAWRTAIVIVVECYTEEGKCILAPYVLLGAISIYREMKARLESLLQSLSFIGFARYAHHACFFKFCGTCGGPGGEHSRFLAGFGDIEVIDDVKLQSVIPASVLDAPTWE